MQFVIRGRNVEVTESLREYAQRKVGRLEKYFDAVVDAEVRVTFTVLKGVHTVEVTIPLSGVTLRAEEKSTDMYASIDEVTEKLEGQIRKHKTRINRRLRQDVPVRGVVQEVTTGTDGAEREEEPFAIVRTKQFVLKPMDVEEAILQMNLLGHSFYVFSHMDTQTVHVVYRRADGQYGLIEPTV